MGGDVKQERPFNFQKRLGAQALSPKVRYTTNTNELHHEVELVAIIGFTG